MLPPESTAYIQSAPPKEYLGANGSDAYNILDKEGGGITTFYTKKNT